MVRQFIKKGGHGGKRKQAKVEPFVVRFLCTIMFLYPYLASPKLAEVLNYEFPMGEEWTARRARKVRDENYLCVCKKRLSYNVEFHKKARVRHCHNLMCEPPGFPGEEFLDHILFTDEKIFSVQGSRNNGERKGLERVCGCFFFGAKRTCHCRGHELVMFRFLFDTCTHLHRQSVCY